MQLIIHLIRNSFLGLSKKPSVPILWMAFPMGIATMMFFAFGGIGGSNSSASSGPPRGTLALIDYDQTPLSGFLKSSFERPPMSVFFKLLAVDDSSQVRHLFEENEAAASLVIPAGFQQAVLDETSIELPFTRNPQMTFSPQMAASSLHTFLDIANRFLQDMQPALQRISADGKNESEIFDSIRQAFFESGPNMGQKFVALQKLQGVNIEVQRPTADKTESMQEMGSGNLFAVLIPGLMLFGLMFVGSGFEQRFATERRGVLMRAQTSPLRPVQILVAQGFVVLLGILICATLMLGLSSVLFRMPIQQPALIFVLTLGFGLTVVGFFKALFSTVKDERAVATISSVAILVLALVGGGMVPSEAFPENFRNFSSYTPVGAPTQGIIHALARGHGLSEVQPYLLRTWGWGLGLCAIGFALAARRRHV